MYKWLLLLLPFAISCKNKKKEESEAGSFPVLSFIRSQVAQVDTSLFSIRKVVQVDGTADTSYIKREDFKNAASDFLNLPDISQKKWRNDYTETKSFDPLLNKAVLTYTAKNPEAAIRKEQVFIQPGNGEEDRVTTIIIDQLLQNGDSTVQKNLIWQVNNHFQIAISTQKNKAPEKIKTIKVFWNDFTAGK